MLFNFITVSTLLFSNAACAKAENSYSNTDNKQECGTITREESTFPWHTVVYLKDFKPYRPICGGSLISNDVILSGAHCFWSNTEDPKSASKYAVAVGPWDDQGDGDKSNVKAIHLAPRFRGNLFNFGDDLAVIIAANAFVYKATVKPVCLSFDLTSYMKQLQHGNTGRVMGWELTSDDKSSAVQKVKDVSYVDINTCITEAPAFFVEYITADKICAKQINSPICMGDGGSGLVFSSLENGIERYYLRGIVSTAPTNNNSSDNECLTDAFATTFTDVLKHENVIMQYWSKQYQIRN